MKLEANVTALQYATQKRNKKLVAIQRKMDDAYMILLEGWRAEYVREAGALLDEVMLLARDLADLNEEIRAGWLVLAGSKDVDVDKNTVYIDDGTRGTVVLRKSEEGLVSPNRVLIAKGESQ